MVSEEVYFWQIQWAGRWMLTSRRHSEREVRSEHPEAIRVDDSRLTILTPENLEERTFAMKAAALGNPDVQYRL